MVFSTHTLQPREHTPTKRQKKYQRRYWLLFLDKIEKHKAPEMRQQETPGSTSRIKCMEPIHLLTRRARNKKFFVLQT